MTHLNVSSDNRSVEDINMGYVRSIIEANLDEWMTCQVFKSTGMRRAYPGQCSTGKVKCSTAFSGVAYFT